MKLLQGLRIVFAFVVSGFPVGPAHAHPHVWATMETDVELGENKEIISFRHKWTFDGAYTAFAVEGLDTNGDGLYSEEELKPLAQTSIEALKEFEYFTFPFIGDKKLALTDAVDYRLEYKDKLLTLYFTVPLTAPVPYEKIQDFSVAVYDPEMYVSLTFADNAPVKIVSTKPVPCTAHVSRPSQRGEDLLRRHPRLTGRPRRHVGIFRPTGDKLGSLGSQFAERVTIGCTP
jgi:ABC-type uncharacterized transport system substrate-binding protein